MKRRRLPRRFKYKAVFSNRLKQTTKKLSLQRYYLNRDEGYHWVVAQESCRLQFYMIGTLYLLITRCIKRSGFDFRPQFFCSFDTPLTHKPGMRMGTGKGKIRCWVSSYKKGDLILRWQDVSNELIRKGISRIIRYKLPIKVKIV